MFELATAHKKIANALLKFYDNLLSLNLPSSIITPADLLKLALKDFTILHFIYTNLIFLVNQKFDVIQISLLLKNDKDDFFALKFLTNNYELLKKSNLTNQQFVFIASFFEYEISLRMSRYATLLDENLVPQLEKFILCRITELKVLEVAIQSWGLLKEASFSIDELNFLVQTETRRVELICEYLHCLSSQYRPNSFKENLLNSPIAKLEQLITLTKIHRENIVFKKQMMEKSDKINDILSSSNIRENTVNSMHKNLVPEFKFTFFSRNIPSLHNQQDKNRNNVDSSVIPQISKILRPLQE